ncbi:hypothetical protein ACTXJ3_18210 [Brachybacterium paraconglomeratum]|uniref:hypothetical protein n=1 Tax=Brachybacterium paraconglomeratum TaxID=173362 RepID=UPI003FD24709
MPIPTRLAIDGLSVRAYGRLDLLETRLVHILGSLDPTPHGARVAEHAALAVVEHSDSCVLLHDGPGIAGAALDALTLSAPDRAVVIARRGVTPWHETLASSGALVLEGSASRLLAHLADAALVVEQAHSALPHSPRIACVPGPILTAGTAGSNALLVRPDVEIVPELDQWARRLHYTAQRPRQYNIAD